MFALDWASWDLKLVGQETAATGSTIYSLTDSRGTAISLEADRELNEGVLKMAGETVRALSGWDALSLRALRLYYQNGKFRAMALPDKFVCGGVDVAPYLPAGLTFFYENGLLYDFRMVKDTVSMKVSGVFVTRAEFSLTVDNAVKNPLAFASKSNYMARIDELERRLNRLIYQHHTLQQGHEKALRALLYFRNTGFLRGPRDINPAVVKRVIQLKSNNPALTVDQVAERLEKEKIKASSKEIHLVFAVFFNDFRK